MQSVLKGGRAQGIGAERYENHCGLAGFWVGNKVGMGAVVIRRGGLADLPYGLEIDGLVLVHIEQLLAGVKQGGQLIIAVPQDGLKIIFLFVSPGTRCSNHQVV